MEKLKKINIILLLLWIILIFGFSQDSGDVSSVKSDGIANVIINIVSDITGKNLDIDICTFIIRKIAHFTEYIILGLLVINVIKDYKTIDTKVLIISIILCFIYACSDEIHQLFVSERSGRITDILIDTAGSFVGIFIYYKKYKKRKLKNI